MPSDWVNYQHSFLYRASNAMNNLSYGVWKDDELNTQYMTYKSSGGAHIMTLPAMGIPLKQNLKIIMRSES